MKKKIFYFAIAIIGLLFTTNVYADTTCNYSESNSNGMLYSYYKVDDDGDYSRAHIWGDFDSSGSTFIKDETEPIINWTTVKQKNGFKGKDYFEDYGCPPYAVFLDGWGHYEYVVADEGALGSFLELCDTKQGCGIMKLLENNELVGVTYTIKYFSNDDRAIGSMPNQTATYGDATNLKRLGFTLYGYNFIGWYIKNNKQWLCKDGKGGSEYKDTCEEEDRVLKRDGATVDFPFDPGYPVINLYAKWRVSSAISPITINGYNLGKSTCRRLGYVWNVTDEGNYCNSDNLRYVYCGDARDIPEQVPSIVSFIVNLLKIAVPIILIFVSVISLLKALGSSKEDEIKKAQTGLFKKVIIAIIVFFIISIVQFVMLWVVDEEDEGNMESCLSCFLNNSCSTTYYKTNVGGKYYCTYLKGGDPDPCD